jgi:hypothetical protein
MLTLALEILHFIVGSRQFNSGDNINEILSSDAFTVIRAAYNDFVKKTESGELGQTAQYSMMLIKYVNTYHDLERFIRDNKLQLVSLSFATNRTYYSRRLAKYQLDFMNIDSTHPGLRELLELGGFSIRRTENQFARVPVDLEQTVNRDAASRLQ